MQTRAQTAQDRVLSVLHPQHPSRCAVAAPGLWL